MNRPVTALLSALLTGSLLPAPAHAAELLLIAGEGDDVDVAAVALRTREIRSWMPGERWRFSLSPEWQIGSWEEQKSGIKKTRIVDSSVTGVLNIRPGGSADSPYYLDFGFGLHLLSHTRLSDDRNFSTSFQFGEFLGLGADFGEGRRYSAAARIQHVSNGGIKEPNPGVTFAQILVTYRF